MTAAEHPAVAALAEQLDRLPWITGLYVGGSLATGDYVPGVSDLDLVALTNGEPDLPRLNAVHRTLDEGTASGSALGCA